MDDAQLEQIAEHVAAALTHHRAPRNPWDRRFNLVIGTIAVASFVFSVGLNWSRVEANERAIQESTARQERMEADLRTMWTTLNAERISNQVVVTKLDAIQQQVSDIKGRLDRGR